jgi:hypothetical protein
MCPIFLYRKAENFYNEKAEDKNNMLDKFYGKKRIGMR